MTSLLIKPHPHKNTGTMESPLLFLFLATFSLSFSQPLCRDGERKLLLQFKESFTIEKFASLDSSAYPKTDSWGRNGSDCCVWDGVECNEDTGRVTGLDLSSSFLYGSLSFNSSLFGLTRLERLNLVDNHFNYSRIPSSIACLSKLTHLNVSLSAFSGQIPNELLSLSRLSFLDLSLNGDYSSKTNLLLLKNPGFHSLTESLTRLKVLNLDFVDVSAGVPHLLANFSSLEFLRLMNCELKGAIPSFIGKLHRLYHLDLSRNRFHGQIPSLANLSRLEYLDLSSNDFESGTLSWLGGHSKLSVLLASESNLIGPLPSSLGNLTRLVALSLRKNRLTGQIPIAFAKLVNLKVLGLFGNNLSGEIKIEMFLRLKNLSQLDFSGNNLSVTINPRINETLAQFVWLGLADCNLIEFPQFLKHQKRLELLDLNNNKISGNIPKWLWNMSTPSLKYLNLGNNSLTGYLPSLLPFVNLLFFAVYQNLFQGLIAIPPPSTVLYQASMNAFAGEIPTLLCNFDSRETTFRNRLEVIDLSGNKLQGKVPHSLANCTMLQYLNLEDNELDDVFPHWLGTLRQLRVLLLGSNRFHGEITKPEEEKFPFPQLRIIVLSYNNFSGMLPSRYFRVWKAMQASTAKTEAKYSSVSSSSGGGVVEGFFYISIKIKGMKRSYYKLNEDLSVVDLSHNKFIAEIPATIGMLKRLISLDLSNNGLGSHIPSSLEHLTKLESLDLSGNKLSGKIPHEIANLNFLQYLNVSYNNLTGPIPQANQMSSFGSTCYEGNPGLCGIPLQNMCATSEPQPPSFEEEQEDSQSPFNFGWKVTAIGFGCGFVVGVLIGNDVVARKQRWFATIFRATIFK